jgi:hypothetical protein
MLVAYFWSFDAKFFGLTVDTLAARPLRINSLVQWSISIEGHTHSSPFFPIEILDAPLPFDELLVITGGTCFRRYEQRAAKTLSPIAVGMMELDGWMHTQTFRAERYPIRIPLRLGVPMLIEWDSSDATMTSSVIIDVPGIKSGIGCGIQRKVIECKSGLVVEWTKIR